MTPSCKEGRPAATKTALNAPKRQHNNIIKPQLRSLLESLL